MTTEAIRHKLHNYIEMAEAKKVKAIYAILEGEINDDFSQWKDKEFIAELDRRTDEYKSGRVKGVAWEDVKNNILHPVKKENDLGY